jgi:hypothetical protein
MSKYNWDLTRIGICRHKIGLISMYIENEEPILSKHTGKSVIQFWTGSDNDGISKEGWACAHSEDDEEDIQKYLIEKKSDL